MTVRHRVNLLLSRQIEPVGDESELWRQCANLFRYPVATIRELCASASTFDRACQAQTLLIVVRMCMEQRALARRGERADRGTAGLNHVCLHDMVARTVRGLLEMFGGEDVGSHDERYEHMLILIESLRLLRQLDPKCLKTFRELAFQEVTNPTARVRQHALALYVWIMGFNTDMVPAAVYETVDAATRDTDMDVAATARGLRQDLV